MCCLIKCLLNRMMKWLRPVVVASDALMKLELPSGVVIEIKL